MTLKELRTARQKRTDAQILARQRRARTRKRQVEAERRKEARRQRLAVEA